MGWCSGTEIFDAVAEQVLRSDASVKHQARILKALAEVMERHDWDCQYDSKYADHEWISEILETNLEDD